MNKREESVRHFLDLLKKSRRGKLQVYIRMNAVVAKTYRMLQEGDAVSFQAKQKNMILEVDCEQNLPQVNADVRKTARVMVNFLSNALRYGSKKSKVVLDVLELSAQVPFSVPDFGKGIDEKYQKRLFDRCYQLPTDGQHKSVSGLGLAIFKDFTEAEWALWAFTLIIRGKVSQGNQK